MAHRYGEAILVRRASGQPARGGRAASLVDDDAPGVPAAFAWRGTWYRIDDILATWRLRDRWWAGHVNAPVADVADVADEVEGARASGPGSDRTGAPVADALPPGERPTERIYFRVLCRDPEGVQVFDLYYDVASGQWMLDRAHD